MGLRDSAKLLEKTVELNQQIAAAQSALFSAQSEQTMLVKKIDDLEKEIDRLKAWEVEKNRYKLVRYEPGVLVYYLKSEENNGEYPAHNLCSGCYDKGVKGILQATPQLQARYRVHVCDRCGVKLAFSFVPPPAQREQPIDDWIKVRE